MARNPFHKNPKVQRFVTHVRNVARENGIKVYLPTAYNVYYDKIGLGGYFSSHIMDMKLACACKKTNIHLWVGTLVHEYSHMEQWMDQCAAWTTLLRKEFPETILEEWLLGIDKPPRQVQKALSLIKEVELDCERRAVKNIVKHDLPINIPRYKKQAEAYVHSYNVIGKIRRLTKPGRHPVLFPAIYNQLPGTLRGQFKTTPQQVERLMLKKCF